MDLEQAYSLIEQTKKTYNLIANHFDLTRQKQWLELEKLKDLFLENQTILDFGCGNARFYSLIQDKNIDYYGIDISENLINLAKKQVPQGKFSIINSDLKLSFQDNFFDIIVSIATLHHIPSSQLRKNLILEFKRVLKNNGILIITVWDFYHGNNFQFLNPTQQDPILEKGDLYVPWKNSQGKVLAQRYFHAFTELELENLVKNTGFKIQELKLIPHNDKNQYFNLLLIAKKLN